VRLEEEYAWRHAGVSAGEYVLLAVTDTGCGMDEATRARIFEPFFTTKEPGKGTGLGLATVYGVIQQSRGHIWVYSEPGQGTTFKLYFPRLDAPEDPASRSRRLALESPPARGAETVLLVEDDPSLRELAATLLRAQGYQVLPAADGPAALALCEARGGEINLLLTDLVMPGMSGRELAEAVAARWAEIPVLYVSGYTDDAVVRHGLLTSGIAFLQKPFTPAQLATRVRQVLDARPERKTAPSG